MMRWSADLLAAIAAVLIFVPSAGQAQPAPQDPDWPCFQNLVPTLSAAEFWAGPEPKADAGWRDDQTVFDLVSSIADRDTPVAEADARLKAYADSIAKPQRATVLPALFGDIVQQINEERTDLIGRLKHLGHRQRGLGDRVTALSAEADKIPPAATGADAALRADLIGDRDLTIRGFQQTQRSLRYACEAPGNLDRRLGQFAHTLMQAMK